MELLFLRRDAFGERALNLLHVRLAEAHVSVPVGRPRPHRSVFSQFEWSASRLSLRQRPRLER